MSAVDDPCSACAGSGKPVSGLPCICKGVGTAAAELQGFREALYASSLREDTHEELLRAWLLKVDVGKLEAARDGSVWELYDRTVKALEEGSRR